MEKGHVIELENGTKYAVAEVLQYNDCPYIYIVNIDNNQDIRFAEITPERLDFVTDNDLVGTLMMEVLKRIQIIKDIYISFFFINKI